MLTHDQRAAIRRRAQAEFLERPADPSKPSKHPGVRIAKPLVTAHMMGNRHGRPKMLLSCHERPGVYTIAEAAALAGVRTKAIFTSLREGRPVGAKGMKFLRMEGTRCST